MKLVLIKTFPSDVEAQLVRLKLESEGIDVFLFNEHFSNLFPYYFNMMGSGIQIKVMESDEERALGVIEKSYPTSESPVCPTCGSDDLEYRANRTIFKILVVSIGLLFGGLFQNLMGRFRCNKCGVEFRN